MTALQLESLAQRIAERVESGHRIEDSFVEAKAEWVTDYQKAARRIAAHANEMRGQPIVWIIGVDEDACTVPGASKEEQGEWFSKVCKFFDEERPMLRLSRVTRFKGRPLVAMLFETDRFPYVVTKGGNKGVFEREVPMREGTRTRSAKRHEIVRLFSAHASNAVEIKRCFVHADVHSWQPPEGEEFYWWHFSLHAFAHSGGDRLYLRRDRIQVAIILPDTHEGIDFAYIDSFETYPNTTTVTKNSNDLVIDGAGPFWMKGTAVCGDPPPGPRDSIRFICRVGYLGDHEFDDFGFTMTQGLRTTRTLKPSEGTQGYQLFEHPHPAIRDTGPPQVEVITWRHPKLKIPE